MNALRGWTRKAWFEIKKRVPYLSAYKYLPSESYPDDTWVVSYPRSGNTWTRFLLTGLLSNSDEISFDAIHRYVPDIYQDAEYIDQLKPPRYIKSHEAWFDRFPHAIYLCRDGRDVMVSYFHYRKGHGHDYRDFSEFLRSGTSWPCPWDVHVRRALETARKRPDDILIIRYEDLLDDAVSQLARIASFADLSASNQRLEDIVERCEFERLQQKESQRNRANDDPDFSRFRAGRRKQWREVFSDSDLQWFYDRAGDVLTELGYSW